MESLFANAADYLSFLNVLASRRLRNLARDNDAYLDEIDEAIRECGDICSMHGSDINFIKEIYDIETKMEIAERKNLTSADVGDLSIKRESLYNKYNQFVDKLPLEDKENLEFFFKQVMDRSLRIKTNNETISKITTEFPEAKSLTPEDVKRQNTIMEIRRYQNPELVEAEQSIEEEMKLPYVRGIHAAPAELLGKKKTVKVEEPELDAGPIVVDNSFFNDDQADNYLREVEEGKAIELEETEKPKVESIEDTPKFEEVPLDNVAEPHQEEVTYKMDSGLSLSDLAVALCGDPNGWFDIYKANEAIIKQRLEEAGIATDEPFENDTELFTGLDLVIPNVFNKSSEPKALAA